MKRTLIILLLVAISTAINAQTSATDYPVIGEPIPGLKLTDVHYYDKNTFDPRDIKGKWIIMDFWQKGCVACVKSFPKVNQLQLEFKNSIQFMLVARNDQNYNKDIKEVFDRYRKNMELNLPIAYDTSIFKQFGIVGVPLIIVIDPEKNVYAVTDEYFLNQETLRVLIENKKPAFNRINLFESRRGIPWKYLVKESERSNPLDLLYNSILCANKGEANEGSWRVDEFASQGFYQVIGASLSELYQLACFGVIHWNRWQPPSIYNNYWRYPILKVSDSSLFKVDNIDKSGLYNYSVTVPKEKATKEYLMEVMQSDLKKYFDYDVAIETRMMPYWKLTATEEARKKLRTKSERVNYRFEPLGVEVQKLSLDLIIDHIASYNMGEHCPFIDETNITEDIDISFNAVMTDMDDVRKALRKQGLILEKSMKKMKVLVIRDKKKQSNQNKQ